jgi:hypothetical protein
MFMGIKPYSQSPHHRALLFLDGLLHTSYAPFVDRGGWDGKSLQQIGQEVKCAQRCALHCLHGTRNKERRVIAALLRIL